MHTLNVPAGYTCTGCITKSSQQNRAGRLYHMNIYKSLISAYRLNGSLNHKNRSKQIAITRLRFGRSLLNDTLGTMKKTHDSGNCDFCYIKEGVDYLLMVCIDFEHL